jgi:hypothetical protein
MFKEDVYALEGFQYQGLVSCVELDLSYVFYFLRAVDFV